VTPVAREVLEAERLEVLALAAEVRARRGGGRRLARAALAEAESLRLRARELRALAASRPRPELAIVRPASPGSA
jgi:hypothetical protein